MNGREIYYLSMKIFAGIVLFTGITFLFSQSIRLDEAQSIWIATKSVSGIIDFAATDVHVPVYFLLLHFWMIIFGNSLIATRFLSLAFFLLTLPIIFRIAKEEGDRENALITTILFATAPFIIWYVSEVRMYTFFILATAISHLYFLRFVRKGGNGTLGLFLANLLGVYSHYFFTFNIITQALYLFLFARRKRLVLGYMFANFLVFLCFVPWLLFVMLSGEVQNSQPYLPAPTTFNLFQLYSLVLFGFQTASVTGIIISLWPLLLVIFFLLFTRTRSGSPHMPYFFLASLVPVILNFLVSIFFKPIFLPRYLIFITPSLFFITGYIIRSMNSLVRPISFSLTAVVLSAFLFIQVISENNPDKKDYREAATYLSTYPTYSDVIAVTPPFTLYPIEYFYNGRAGLNTIPQWNRYISGPVTPFSQENLEVQIEEFKKSYTRLYAVYSYDQGYEQEIRNYLDRNYLTEETVEFPGVTIKAYRLRYDTGTTDENEVAGRSGGI